MAIPTKPVTPRIPEEVGGIQVNFCKNPMCSNFGRPANMLIQPRGRPGQKPATSDTYVVIGTSKAVPILKCKKCGECPTIKSNLGIFEELARISAYLDPPHIQTSCPVQDCENNYHPVYLWPGRYFKYNQTTAGNPRYRCRICGKTFTVRINQPPLRRRSPLSHLNKKIFLDLINKTPFKGICQKYDISMKTVYDKIAFFYRQCRLFAANRERKFGEINFKELSIAVDRQDYRLNWPSADNRRNIVVQNIASADTKSGFIFACHLNYDSSLNLDDVTETANKIGDGNLKAPFRTFARLWVACEQEPPQMDEEEIKESKNEPPIFTQVRRKYAKTKARSDVEAEQTNFMMARLPHKGVLVHAEYTMYAHFQFLKKMLAKTDKIVFYMDQESGIRAACFSAFWEDVLAKRVDAFFVSIDKTLTIDQKKRLQAQVNRQMADFIDENPIYEQLWESEIRHIIIKNELSKRIPLGPWGDYWLQYPFPDMSEPRKAICWLSDIGDSSYSLDDLATLFLYASLHSVDRFFMRIRRKTSLLERPIQTSSSARRTWYAYDAYNPAVVEMLIEIFRVYFNYIAPPVRNKKKSRKSVASNIRKQKSYRTPAMKLGVAKSPSTIEDILYYKPTKHQLLDV